MSDPFVGAGHREILDGLLREVDRMCAEDTSGWASSSFMGRPGMARPGSSLSCMTRSRRPRRNSLQASNGAERGIAQQYPVGAQGNSGFEGRLRLVAQCAPELCVVERPGRSGGSLAADFVGQLRPQMEAHGPAFALAWSRALHLEDRIRKLHEDARERFVEAAQVGGLEGLGRALTAADLTIPVMGLVVTWARLGVGYGLRKRREQKPLLDDVPAFESSPEGTDFGAGSVPERVRSGEAHTGRRGTRPGTHPARAAARPSHRQPATRHGRSPDGRARAPTRGRRVPR